MSLVLTRTALHYSDHFHTYINKLQRVAEIKKKILFIAALSTIYLPIIYKDLNG